MKHRRRLIAAVLCVIVLSVFFPSTYADDSPFSITVQVGNGLFPVRAFLDGYPNNLYLSLSDLTAALSSTEKQFRLEFQSSPQEADSVVLTSGQPATALAGNSESTVPSTSSLLLRRNRLFLDGQELKYYTFRYGSAL